MRMVTATSPPGAGPPPTLGHPVGDDPITIRMSHQILPGAEAISSTRPAESLRRLQLDALLKDATATRELAPGILLAQKLHHDEGQARWVIDVYAPGQSDALHVYQLGFLNLSDGRYEANKAFLEKLIDSIQYHENTPADDAGHAPF